MSGGEYVDNTETYSDGVALRWNDGSASDDEARDREDDGAQHLEGLHDGVWVEWAFKK